MAKWLRQRFAKPLFPGSNPGGASIFTPIITHLLFTAILKSRQQYTYDVIELGFETSTPFNFQAGQFVTFKIADNKPPCFRAYSISSVPEKDGNTFETCLKVIPGGRGTNWLNSLQIGDKIDFLGPSGKFIFQTAKEKSVLFIATGTGVAPFRAIIKNQLEKGNNQKMTLLFGVRHEKDIFYKEVFEELAKKYQNFNFILTLSQPENPGWSGFSSRVTTHLEKMTIDADKTEAYICGLKDMIGSVEEILKAKGLGEEAIHFEKYD